jgi:hypothetical protein
MQQQQGLTQQAMKAHHKNVVFPLYWFTTVGTTILQQGHETFIGKS